MAVITAFDEDSLSVSRSTTDMAAAKVNWLRHSSLSLKPHIVHIPHGYFKPKLRSGCSQERKICKPLKSRNFSV